MTDTEETIMALRQAMAYHQRKAIALELQIHATHQVLTPTREQIDAIKAKMEDMRKQWAAEHAAQATG